MTPVRAGPPRNIASTSSAAIGVAARTSIERVWARTGAITAVASKARRVSISFTPVAQSNTKSCAEPPLRGIRVRRSRSVVEDVHPRRVMHRESRIRVERLAVLAQGHFDIQRVGAEEVPEFVRMHEYQRQVGGPLAGS